MKDNDRLELDRIVFIGRTYDEYLRMFDLDEYPLRDGGVLDCPAGPSSFTAEAHGLGMDAVACDVLYDLLVEKLEGKGREDIAHVYQKVDGVPHLYVWKYYRDRAEIFGLRHTALSRFATDYPCGREEGRYVQAKLPHLPFPDKSFSLVLSSHFLFLYGDRLSPAFHIEALREMIRVSSGEVRVYPLQGLDAQPYPQMEEILSRLRSEGTSAEIVPTPFEFQRGANKMLVLKVGG